MIHLKTKVDENNNTVVQTNATKKSNSKTSPNFTSDILRQTKQQGQRTRYYIDYKNLYDGLHPDSLIAKLWLRRIFSWQQTESLLWSIRMK
jgi:hypothetical protein